MTIKVLHPRRKRKNSIRTARPARNIPRPLPLVTTLHLMNSVPPDATTTLTMRQTPNINLPIKKQLRRLLRPTRNIIFLRLSGATRGTIARDNRKSGRRRSQYKTIVTRVPNRAATLTNSPNSNRLSRLVFHRHRNDLPSPLVCCSVLRSEGPGYGELPSGGAGGLRGNALLTRHTFNCTVVRK